MMMINRLPFQVKVALSSLGFLLQSLTGLSQSHALSLGIGIIDEKVGDAYIEMGLQRKLPKKWSAQLACSYSRQNKDPREFELDIFIESETVLAQFAEFGIDSIISSRLKFKEFPENVKIRYLTHHYSIMAGINRRFAGSNGLWAFSPGLMLGYRIDSEQPINFFADYNYVIDGVVSPNRSVLIQIDKSLTADFIAHGYLSLQRKVSDDVTLQLGFHGELSLQDSMFRNIIQLKGYFSL